MAVAVTARSAGAGHNVEKTIFRGVDKGQWDRLVCPSCTYLLRDAVQPSCGHRMCQACVDHLFRISPSPICPECGDVLVEEEGSKYFPDRYVRRELQGLSVVCPNYASGCKWEGTFKDLEQHLAQSHQNTCEYCCKTLSPEEASSHSTSCPLTPHQCPLTRHGCTHTAQMTNEESDKHIMGNITVHMRLLIGMRRSMLSLQRTAADGVPTSIPDDVGYESMPLVQSMQRFDAVERDGPESSKNPDVVRRTTSGPPRSQPTRDGPTIGDDQPKPFKSKTEVKIAPTTPRTYPHAGMLPQDSARAAKDVFLQLTRVEGDFADRLESVSSEAKKKDEEIDRLRLDLNKLEKLVRAKNAELEDRDFRLSLIENSNHDGTMVWKVPQFSQRMEDAKSGKYTSIFSLPFYTSRYGYKMCLRLYILGDGIGKGSHMSLFFVIMRGEFDNILQWPFTHKVSFRLINQTGGRDIVDTFQPDPMSSSFRKPKNDMNIASGCPRFVSHDDLHNGGYIVEDTIFIRCSVDKSTIRDP